MGAREVDDDLWVGGVVPYEINPDLGNTKAIHEAMAILEAKTNVRFVERFLQDDYVWFAKQTQGNPHAGTGRNGGRQFVSASGNSIGTLLHEIGHALGLAHEHQRSDRDDFIIFHADHVSDGDPYEKKDTPWRSPQYDFNSIMHYSGRGAGGVIFESKTGSPPPEDIGSNNVLTPIDIEFLTTLYPSPPVVRRTGGHDGAGTVWSTSAVATPVGNNIAVVVNAVTNGDGDYQVVMWEISNNGVIVRTFDPSSATGGQATSPRIVANGSQFVTAMRDSGDRLLLITHDWQLVRTGDSHGQAGRVSDQDLIHIGAGRVLTPCVTEAGELLNIVWKIGLDGSVDRISEMSGPNAVSVKGTLLADGTVALLCDDGARLVLSTWAIEKAPSAEHGQVEKVVLIAESGGQMGRGSSPTVVETPSGTVVVVCRADNDELLLIPFAVGPGGSTIERVAGKDARAGKIQEVTAVPRPYGLVTAVASEGGQLLLIKWSVTADGEIRRLGQSGTQAGDASLISMVALPFTQDATICTTVADSSGRLLPITWDDLDGPGELDRYRLPSDGRPIDRDNPLRDLGGGVVVGPGGP